MLRVPQSRLKRRCSLHLSAGAIAALQGHLKRQMEEQGSPNVPRPDPTTATRRKGLGCCRGVGMGAVQDKIYRRNPDCRQKGRRRGAAFYGALRFFLQNAALPEWAMLGSNQRPLPCEGSAMVCWTFLDFAKYLQIEVFRL